ncbi:hypothetical protein lerEdw1_019383 [Lerista edwardsae]|nr:hypothetical protein lerEdw1_019383 [Lerista edwardsae]
MRGAGRQRGLGGRRSREEEGDEKMASTDYSTYSQAAAQQGYTAYAAQPAQGYAQTTQAYGQQSYGTYGQPTDVSYTQAQSTATYGQTAYAATYGQPPTGYTAPAAPQAYSQPVQGYGTAAYDTTTATVTTTQASYAAPSAYGTQPAYPTYGQQAATSAPARPQDGSKPVETSQPQSSTTGYSQPSLGYGQSNYSYQVPGSYPMQPVTAPPSYPPTSYSSSQPSSYEQSSYSQQSNYSQPSSYGQQTSYGQQSSYGQQPPTSYPPPAGSYSQTPSQYNQPSSSYGQQSSFRQDHPSSMGVYGQDSGGFSGPGENRSMSGPDNRGRGRGGFDRGGVSRGPPLDLDDDADNSSVYVQGLTDNVTLEELTDFFKQCGVVKMNKRNGQPMITIYLDKDTGKPKGDATVCYDDPPTAKAAIEWLDEEASWIVAVPEGCSEVAAAETEAGSEEAAAWIEAALEGDGEEDPGDPLDPSWSRWEAEAEDAEDQEKWTRENIARSAETDPTSGR